MTARTCLAVPILIAIAGCAGRQDHAAAGDPAGAARSRVTTLLTQPLPADVGREGRVLTVELPPGAATPPHRHDGAIFAYVAEGAVVSALDDGPEERFAVGQAWYEWPGQVHRVSRNASATEPAKLVVFFLTEPGRPVLRPEK